MDFSFDFSSLEFDFSGKKKQEEADEVGEFLRSAKVNRVPVEYENALDMAKAVNMQDDYFCIVGGSFIYGDFIEALCDIHDLQPKRVNVTTLGMGEENIDSLVNIIDYLGCGEVNLIVSNYFAAVERNKLMPYMIQEAFGRPFNVAVCASHAKICTIDSEKGQLTMFGSANLSSSNNVKEFQISHDPGLFSYCNRIIDGIMDRFTVIRGLKKETIFENNSNNTGRKMFAAVKEIADERK